MAMKQAAALLAQEDDDDDDDDEDKAMASGAQQPRDGMSAVPAPVPSLPNGMQTDAL